MINYITFFLIKLNSKISDVEDYVFLRLYWTNPTYSLKVKNGVVYIEYYCATSEGVGGHAYQVADLPSAAAPGRRIRSAAWTAGGDGMRHGHQLIYPAQERSSSSQARPSSKRDFRFHIRSEVTGSPAPRTQA